MCKTNRLVVRSQIYKHFSLIISSNFWYQHFVAVCGNLGGKVPVVDNVLSSHEQKIDITTSLDENCIEFEFQTDWNYYVDFRQTYLALKLKLVRGRGYETYKNKEVEKEHKEEVKADEEETSEEAAPVPLVTHVNNLLHSIFSIVEVYINSQQIYHSNGLNAQILHFQRLQGNHLWIKGTFALRGLRQWRSSWWNYGSVFAWTFFHKDIENA